MPFYEYECAACGHYLEAMQKVSDTPLRKCPACGRQKLARLISAPVFRLKGAGWYETDFKSEQERKRNLAEHPEKDADKEKEKKPEESTVAAEKPEQKGKDASEKSAAEKPAASETPAARKPAVAKPASTAAVKPPKKKPSSAKAGSRRATASGRRRAAAR